MSSLAFLVTELQVCRIPPAGNAAPCPSASYLSLQVLGQQRRVRKHPEVREVRELYMLHVMLLMFSLIQAAEKSLSLLRSLT